VKAPFTTQTVRHGAIEVPYYDAKSLVVLLRLPVNILDVMLKRAF
jgi:hypothetical protein